MTDPSPLIETLDPLDTKAATVRTSPSPVDRARRFLKKHRTEIMLIVPAALYLVIVCSILMGRSGVIVAAALTAAIAILGPRTKADTLLSLYRAEPIAPGQGMALRTAITTLVRRAELATDPALAIVPSLAVGAFSVGAPPRTALLMTEGLLRRHTLEEIVALAAHEIAHMRNGDLPIFALADAVTRLAQALFYFGVALAGIEAAAWITGETVVSKLPVILLLAAPLSSSTLQLALPRQIEYDADATAARLLGDARLMAAVARKQTADAGSFIDDLRLPVPQRRAPVPSPLRTHPGGEERAIALAPMSDSDLGPRLMVPDEPLISLVGFGPIEMKPRNRWPGLWF